MQLPQTEVLDEVTSTNSVLAARWREGKAAPYASIRARYQSQGRGRLGREWIAPRDTALLYSALIPSTGVPSRIPLCMGVALVDILNDPRLSLKWPNDVLLHGNKLAGILTEHVGVRNGVQWLVVGVGVNLTDSPDYAARIDRDPDELAEALTEKLLHLEQLFDRYPALLGHNGHPVRALLPDSTVISGTTNGITSDGALIIMTDAGPVTVTAAEVTLEKIHE